ncbi:chemotaxis protein CheW [Agarivorans sp. Alg241-V36]|uniref:chemotaxis protein CheW n=1 Tax=Agarivorans sp. Alg241-V36 TaxID=2305992 RepID=UPI0013D4DBC9|nr:chemotaxis protein CheW [Agarivorans sp. Alg241-V36]
MNSDKLMEQALGDYFDSLLSETPPEPEKVPELKSEPEAKSNEDQALEPQAKPLAELFAEAEQRVAAVAEAQPVLLPIKELPEQAPELEVEETVEELEQQVEEQDIAVETETSLALQEESTAAQWQNIDTDNDFQVLFFEVAGVTFGVPLTQLGGIHRISEVSPLFGKPPWFSGIMIEREEKLSVVDTAKWVMPNQPFEPEYKYLVMLGESAWGLSCEKLFGTERLNRDDVKWRSTPGQRPWLAGMVKQKMCALLHVEELQQMLADGVDIEGH